MSSLKAFLDKLDDGIIIFNRNGKIDFLSKKVRDIFGLNESDDVRKILKMDDRIVFFRNIQKLADKGGNYSNFIRLIDKDGELSFCWLKVFKFNDKFVFEIFDLAPLENRSATISDSSYIKILRYMSEGIAHSIRNPIMSAGGMLSRIKIKLQNEHKDEKLIRYIEVVEKSLYRIISIIANLEVVSGSLPVRLQRIDIGKVVREIANKYQDGVYVDIDESEKVYVFIDRMHLSFILEEIIKNAKEAVEGLDNPKIEISIFKENKKAFIRIKDNGEGIEEDRLSLATIPFYSTKPSNMGIGLSLAKFLIEGYQGDISINSRKGEGTEVTIVLPIEKRADIRIKELND